MDLSLHGRLRLQHLRGFMAIAETRHVGRAAERLHLTQPALSKTLSSLEKVVGRRLFERGRQGARLTTDGEAFLPRAMAVLDALVVAERAMQPDRDVGHNVVHVGALPTVAPDLLPAALEEFGRVEPGTRVVLRTSINPDLVDAVKTGSVDIAIGRMSDPALLTGLTFEFLYSEPLVFVVRAGHPLAATGLVHAAQLASCELVLSSRGTVPRQNADAFLSAHGLGAVPVRLETLSVSVARLFVQRTDVVWMAPLGAVREDLRHGTLARLDIPTPGTEEPVGLLRRRDDTLSSAAAEFVTVLRRTVADRGAAAMSVRTGA